MVFSDQNMSWKEVGTSQPLYLQFDGKKTLINEKKYGTNGKRSCQTMSYFFHDIRHTKDIMYHYRAISFLRILRSYLVYIICEYMVSSLKI